MTGTLAPRAGRVDYLRGNGGRRMWSAAGWAFWVRIGLWLAVLTAGLALGAPGG